ncbi:MAG: VanW family protein [Patescibacteria group bacterium]|jgi:vancomycin resistance protein YoaR
MATKIKVNAPVKDELKKTVKKFNKTVGYVVLVLIVLLLLSAISVFGYEYNYKNKIYPGIKLNDISVSGKTYAELADQVTTKKTALEQAGLTFIYQDHSVTISAKTTAADAPPILTINVDATVQTAYNIGRANTTSQNIITKMKTWWFGNAVPLQYQLDRSALLEQLQNEFAVYPTPYTNATFKFSKDHSINVVNHEDGAMFVWNNVLNKVEEQLAGGQVANVKLELVTDPAPVTTELATIQESEALTVAKLAPLTLTYEANKFTVAQDELESWLIPTEPGVGFNTEIVTEYLNTVASEIDVPVKEGKFSLNVSGDEITVKQFQDGEDGLTLTIDKTITALTTAVLENQQSNIALVVEVAKPRVSPDNLNDLGIKELLGTGETSFAGSPSNRVYNIKKGAEMLNGILITPDETFSLLSILSPIDEAHDWKPELVIKDKKLKAEAGGGLCQVGTTSFRAAMLSGLPIVERRNHTWAVSYYNYNGKAGVDATIYEPSPDFKFKNDTGHYILWRSRVEGSKLYFELWGTSDGRKGSFTTPTNYNYASPGAAVETIDPSLPPGTRNCDSHVFTGVSASFDYTIEQPNGTVDKTTYTSVYKPQAATCTVGPKEEATPPTNTNQSNNNTNSSKNSNKNTNTNKTNTNSSNKNS